MIQIRKGGFYQILKAYLKDSQIYLVLINGTTYKHISQKNGRFQFSDDKLKVLIYDEIFKTTYWAKTNELENAAGVYSNVSAIVDENTVSAALGLFIGI